jgi:hypothetical protein
MIEVRDLTKRYGPTLAVDALSFDVRPGAVTGFLGANGSGKSTTMRLILGLDAPDAGTARIGGRRFRELRWPLREVGSQLEARAFHPGRSARDHLAALAASNDIPRRRVDEVLGQVGLADAARRRAGTFSLGMGQRLGLAAALLGDPVNGQAGPASVGGRQPPGARGPALPRLLTSACPALTSSSDPGCPCPDDLRRACPDDPRRACPDLFSRIRGAFFTLDTIGIKIPKV